MGMNPEAHKRMLWDGNAQTSNESEWQMSPSRKGSLHTHTIMLSVSEMSQLKGGRYLDAITETLDLCELMKDCWSNLPLDVNCYIHGVYNINLAYYFDFPHNYHQYIDLLIKNILYMLSFNYL